MTGITIAAITTMLQKVEICQIYQEIGGCYKGMIIMQSSVIFVHLGTALMLGKSKCKIPLALYIRLEYSSFESNENTQRQSVGHIGQLRIVNPHQ